MSERSPMKRRSCLPVAGRMILVLASSGYGLTSPLLGDPSSSSPAIFINDTSENAAPPAIPATDTGTPNPSSPSGTPVTPSPSTGEASPDELPGPGSIAASAAPSGTYSVSAVPAAAHGWTSSGRLPFHVSASIAEIYDDNINVQPKKVSDEITQISLKGEYRVGNRTTTDGNYLDVSYAPSYDAYASNPSKNNFNQNADVVYQHRFSKLALTIDQAYSRESSTSAAAGDLVTSGTITTTASADYRYSSKLALTSNFTQTVTDYETAGYASSNEWVEDLFFLYKLDSKVSLGLGPKFGWLDIGQAPNQTYQQILARTDYGYSDKLTFNLSVGAEYREYQDSMPDNKLSPVFSLSSSFRPYRNTTVTLTGQSHYAPSYNLNGQDYVATSVTFTGSQRFLQKFSLNLSLGYENDSYESAGATIVGPTRDDNYFFASTGIDWNPNNLLTASVFYKYQKDDSNIQMSTFNDNQVGISASVTY